jgi:hypothetical protein
MSQKEEVALYNAAEIEPGHPVYNTNSKTAECSQKNKLETIRTGFLSKRLVVNTSDHEMDTAFKAACRKIGRNNRNKYRALFYEIIAKEFKKRSMYE